ncbi:MAG: serine/threonine protein kinase [Prevotella sp.]|nr:serine/threonine protein kinase [Prevotella sp.]
MIKKDSSLHENTVLDSGERKYRIVSVLGQGGFGITYLSTAEILIGNVPTEGSFAIKEHFPSEYCYRENCRVIAKDDKKDDFDDSKTDFIAEAKRLQAIGTQSPNIVKVNEVFEANGTAYYVMQYIHGQSLSSYVKDKGKLSYNEAISLLSPIFNAVDYLHKSRINHLDIKPDNIMLHETAHGIMPILIDFGLSIHFKKNGGKTSSKGIMGVSDGYSPLEQYLGIKVFSPATDIYALAATLLFSLTGKTPQNAADLKVSEIRPVLAKLVPADYIEGICKALTKSNEDRTSSIAALKNDLGVCSNSGKKTRKLNLKEEKKKKYRLYAFISSICLIVIICLVLWHTLSPKPEPKSLDLTSNDTITTDIKKDSVPDVSKDTPTDENEISSSSDDLQIPTDANKTQQPHVTDKPTKQNISQNKPQSSATTTGSLSLGYATWKGGIKNGNPDGKGTLTFNSVHSVDRSTSYQANPGDYFIATYDNGSLISGKLYDSEGNLLKTIIP